MPRTLQACAISSVVAAHPVLAHPVLAYQTLTRMICDLAGVVQVTSTRQLPGEGGLRGGLPSQGTEGLLVGGLEVLQEGLLEEAHGVR